MPESGVGCFNKKPGQEPRGIARGWGAESDRAKRARSGVWRVAQLLRPRGRREKKRKAHAGGQVGECFFGGSEPQSEL